MEFAHLADHTVTGFNRAAQPDTDEITGTCTPQHWNVAPPNSYDVRMYVEVDGVPIAKSKPEIDAILWDDVKQSAMTDVRDACQRNIYDYFSAPVQQSMSLGIYPSEKTDAMTMFIANCIEYENLKHDELSAATTQFQIDQIMAGIAWPVPEVA